MESYTGWIPLNEGITTTAERIQYASENRLSFGIDFLDKAVGGILKNDLVLLGAPTGVGKTQFAMNLALANLKQGKKVHMIALEAGNGEIHDRIKYTLLAKKFFNDPKRPKSFFRISYSDWFTGGESKIINCYEDEILEDIKHYENLNVLYKTGDFTSEDMVDRCLEIHQETDLLIVDHVHYFDIDPKEDENRALKEIAKTAKMVSQVSETPIVLIAHLRKKDRFNKEIVAGIDEFHGSSDLAKIATKAITIGRGNNIPGTSRYETFFRMPKCRIEGSITGYVFKMLYDIKKGCYDDLCKVGRFVAGGTEFNEIPKEELPQWAK